MKKIFVLFFLICSLLHIYGQTKNFECDYFSLEYPANLKPAPIMNAPHMITKFQSQNYIFTASTWKYNIPKDVSVWDDKVYNIYRQQFVNEEEIIDVTRETIQTKGGAHKCLKIKTNIPYQEGTYINMRALQYIMIHNGNLFIFGFFSSGKYTKASDTKNFDKIMTGLKFKNQQDDYFYSYFLERIKELNAQCPIKVDYCTTHTNVLLIGKTMTIKTLVDKKCEDMVYSNDFLLRMCDNFSTALPKSFFDFLDDRGYSITYLIYNKNDKLIKKIKISPKDILEFY